MEQLRKIIWDLTKEAKIEGESFDSIFQIDGVPLWWFYNRLITRNMLPGVLRFEDICAGKKPSKFSGLKNIFLKKTLVISDRLKHVLNRYKYCSLNNKAIFFTYTNHHTDKGIYRIQGVLENMENGTPLTISPFVELPKKFSFSPMIYAYSDKNLRKEARKKAKYFHLLWKKKAKCALKGVAGKYWSHLSPHLSLLFSKDFLYITFLYYEIAKKLIKEEKPSVLCVTANIGLIEKCIIVASNIEKIPVLHIQHGFSAEFRNTDLREFDTLHMAVFGEKDKKWVCGTGVDPSRVFVTGSTLFDGLEKHISPRKEKIDVNTILLLAQPLVEDGVWTIEERENFFEDLLTLCTQFGAKLHIKLHPRDNSATYASLTKGGAVIVSENLHEEMQKADLLVGVISTTLSEAAALNKPALIIDPNGVAETQEYAMKGVVLYTRTIEEALQKLPDFLSFFCSDAYAIKRKKFIDDHFCKLDGNAAKRIAGVVTNISKKKQDLKIESA